MLLGRGGMNGSSNGPGLIAPSNFKPRHRRSRLASPSKPAIRAFVVFLGLLCCFLLYGRYYFYRDPLSIFFDESRAYVRWYSAYRQQQADSFIEHVTKLKAAGYNLSENVLPKKGSHPSVCATFLTVARRGVHKQYLEASIGSMLDRLTPEERRDINLQVFFASISPASHPTWESPWLRDMVDEVYTYANLSQETRRKAHELENAQDTFNKSPFDYAIPLQHCYDTRSPYIALFEDDVLLAEGWLARAMKDLSDLQESMLRQGRDGQWIYLRLFNQERSTGWASHRVGGNNELLISLPIAAVAWALLRQIRRKVPGAKPHLDGWTVTMVCLVAIPTCVVLFFQTGKASLLPPKPGLREEAFGCCAQGLIYNREQIPGLAWLLQLGDRPEGQDLITRDYAAYYKLARWSSYPMTVQHIGVKTTIQKNQKESQAVWSMEFENLNPKQLCREHAQNVREMYGVFLPRCP